MRGPYETYDEIEEVIENFFNNPEDRVSHATFNAHMRGIMYKINRDMRCLLVQDNGFSLVHNLALIKQNINGQLKYWSSLSRAQQNMMGAETKRMRAIVAMEKLEQLVVGCIEIDSIYPHLHLLYIREGIREGIGARVRGNTGFQTAVQAFGVLFVRNCDLRRVLLRVIQAGHEDSLAVANADNYTFFMMLILDDDWLAASEMLRFVDSINLPQRNRWGESALSLTRCLGARFAREIEAAGLFVIPADQVNDRTRLKKSEVLKHWKESNETQEEHVFKGEIASTLSAAQIEAMHASAPQQPQRRPGAQTAPRQNPLGALRASLEQMALPEADSVEIDRDTKVFDLIMQEDVDVNEYLNDDPDNRLFITDGGRRLFPFTLSSARRAIADGNGVFFGCNAATGFVGPDNVDRTWPLFRPLSVSSLTDGYIVLNDLVRALDSGKRAFRVIDMGLRVASVASSRPGGGAHCGPTDGGPILRLAESEINFVNRAPRQPTPRQPTPRAASPQRRQRKVKVKKADCLAPRYKWQVGQGCFELVSSSPRRVSPVRRASSPRRGSAANRKVKVKKADCVPPRYTWQVGRGCFEQSAPVAPAQPQLGRLLRGIRKPQCLPPGKTWVVGVGCRETL